MKIKKFFKNVAFDEDSHTYTINGKKAGMSTTGLIHQYCKPFDENKIAPMSAKKQNKTVKKILDEWAYKREYSCERGNQVHLYAQGLWSGISYKTDFDKVEDRFLEQLKQELPILQKQALSFYDNYKDSYEFIEEEQFLYDAEYDLAGSIDLLLKNKNSGEYAIVDFKTYGDLNKKAYNKMLVPLHKIDDNNVNHLSLQLEVYKQIFERETKLVVGETFGVYFNVGIDDYEVIEAKDLKKEVVEILERRKKMQSIPVLMYGKSGTGKTASLRNYNKDDLAYINILDKPLPFKSNVKVNSLNRYETIIAAIKKTEKKTIFIDDAGFLLTNELFSRASEKGYGKFTDMACNFDNLINEIKKIEGGKVVVISMHEDNDGGDIKLKTAGKMIENNSVIEGNFTIAIRSMCNNGDYIFRTKNNGSDITKTPIGMFDEEEIPNDFKEVDKAIRKYYDLDKVENKKTEGEIK